MVGSIPTLEFNHNNILFPLENLLILDPPEKIYLIIRLYFHYIMLLLQLLYRNSTNMLWM